MFEQLVGVEGRVPQSQVVHAGGQRSGRIRLSHAQIRGVGVTLPALIVSGDAPGDDAQSVIVAGVLHPQRVKYALLDEFFVGLPGRLFNDGPQQGVARVAVRKALSGGKVHRLILEKVNHFWNGEILAP